MALIEREDELACLRELLAECRRGRGQVAVIGGGTAVGKTTLAQAFAEHAAGDGALVLGVTGSRAERLLPFALIDQLRHEADPGARSGPQPESRTNAQVAGELHAALAALAEDRPVLVVIDNVHEADEASLGCLLFLLRRIRSARILVVLAEAEHLSAEYLQFRAELFSLAYCRRMRLFPLSAGGILRRLAVEFGEANALELTPSYYAFSGGNPLLIEALIEDQQLAARTGSAAPVVGETYRRAVAACLHRCPPRVREVAAGLAVLHAAATPPRLRRLLELEPEVIDQAMQVLGTAGLLEHGRLRHLAAQTAVLEGVPTAERVELHLKAARLLRQERAEPAVIARLLLPVAAEPVVLPHLWVAATEALADGHIELAIECLEAGLRVATTERERAALTVRLVAAQWQLTPAVAAHRLSGLVEFAERGLLDRDGATTLVSWLLWFGRAAEAAVVLTALGGAGDERAARRHLLDGSPALAGARSSAATVLAEVLTGGPTHELAARADAILECTPLQADNLAEIESALLALVYADRIDSAARWCAPLLAEAAAREVPTWRSVLSLVWAEIALRRGEPAEAEEHAAAAMAHVSADGLGVRIGTALGLRVLALTELGQLAAAGEQLRRPVPEEVLESRHGLPYLHARGVYFLATDRPRAALAELDSCGVLVRRAKTDLPALVPWRGELAQAHLRLGGRSRARALAERQLAMCGAEPSRARGISLRMQAVTVEPRQRVTPLRQAAHQLQLCGDRLELAKATAELARAQHACGDLSSARMTVRQAIRLARQCGAEQSVCADLLPLTQEPAVAEVAEDCGQRELARLSSAERRVAALAARGHSNREIARDLFITVSTVEQHLTNVYRKLNLNGRAELPIWEPGVLTVCPN